MPGGVTGIPLEYTKQGKRKKKRKPTAANAKQITHLPADSVDHELWKGGRPTKGQDDLVRFFAELIHIADAIHENEEVRNLMAQGGITVELPDGRLLDVDGVDEIAMAVGRFICGDVQGKHLKPKYRPYVLGQLKIVLEGKARKSRNDRAKMRAAYREAKAEQKGLHRDDNPTFAEVDRKYYSRTGCHLDRRALLRDPDCHVRPDKRGVKKLATA